MSDQSCITWRDRGLALLTLFVVDSVVVGAKAAILTGLLLTSATVLHSHATGARPSFTLRSIGVAQYPVALWIMFALLALSSGVWSLSARASAEAGLNLILVIIGASVLVALWARLSEGTAILIGGWTAIGFVVSLAIVLIDMANGSVLVGWFLEHLDVSGHGGATWVQRSRGAIVSIALEFWNWNIAGVNLLFWPMLLLISLVERSLLWKGLALAAVLLTVAATLLSVHATSSIAILVGTALFVLSRAYPRAAVGLLMAGFTIAAVAVIPIATYAHTGLRLHHASWVPPTLQARIVIWKHTAEQVLKAPIVGIGANSTKYWRLRHETVPKVKDHWQEPTVNNHAHNYFLQVWFELGALGCLLFTAAGLSTLRLIPTMQTGAQPYAIATAGAAITMFSATWNLWHLWLVATLGIALALLVLGNTLAAPRALDRVAFHQIWLPSGWTPKRAA